MSDHSAKIVARTLQAAYLPGNLRAPEDVVRTAVELLADNCSERGTAALAEAIGGDLGRLAAARVDKIEHSSEEMIQLLAKEAGVAPTVADDVLGALYETLWIELGRDLLEDLMAQSPYDLARELRAAMPGQKRGSF